jgi:hypothetical protein
MQSALVSRTNGVAKQINAVQVCDATVVMGDIAMAKEKLL